ncbi:hypothetical protein A2U01_0039147 [Trifolium medium]|uniref:Uncharacterized protein n=1 Tax=Trifolium medium TaxID=97028 RepID=A0A392Q349_9FABA|nr:hypothetical protein [Trifolium medium]
MRDMDKLRMDICLSRLGAGSLFKEFFVQNGSKVPQLPCTLRYSPAYPAQGTTAGVGRCVFFALSILLAQGAPIPGQIAHTWPDRL